MNQKGLAPILIVITIAALVGGYLLYQNYQNQSKPPTSIPTLPPQQTTQPSPVAKVTPTATPSAQLSEPIKLAQQDLAKMLNADPSQISVVKIENIMWRNGSLGCPKPGVMYTQAIEPGYKAIFSYHQKTYEYHTNKAGYFVTCESK